jgi:cytochrome c peroxidase
VAPTTLAQVKPNHNLGTTSSYFWNGSFANGNYTSLAFAFQTRDNCQIVEFGFVEGAASDPAARVGDPNNVFDGAHAKQDDTKCRPVDGTLGSAANAAAITAVDQAEQKFAQGQIEKITGLQFEELARVIDAYSVFALRLPPNPLHQEYVASQGATPQLDAQTMSDIPAGAALFTGAAGCTTCHVADDTYASAHPFTDDLNHGSGAGWLQQFIATYSGTNDPRVVAALGTDTFPEPILDALSASVGDHEVNTWTTLDYFLFACFDVTNCIAFEDPLAVRGDTTEETRRLNLILDINLADPDRQFIPGDIVGQAAVNTPSLRGVWTQYNLLHHGLGHSVREAVLAPGHPALQPGENGFAIDQFGHEDVHGSTTTLTPGQVQSLVTYVDSIQ